MNHKQVMFIAEPHSIFLKEVVKTNSRSCSVSTFNYIQLLLLTDRYIMHEDCDMWLKAWNELKWTLKLM